MQTRKSHQKKIKLKKKGGKKKKMTIKKVGNSNNVFGDNMLYFTIEYNQETKKFNIRKVVKANAEKKNRNGLPIYLVKLLD
jgi:hypothetical protein